MEALDAGRPEKALLSGMLVGYFVFNCAQLDNITSYVMFFSVLAYLHQQGVGAPKTVASSPRKPMLVAVALVPALALSGVAIYTINVRNFRPAAAITLMSPLLQADRGPEALGKVGVSLEAKWTGSFEIREQNR